MRWAQVFDGDASCLEGVARSRTPGRGTVPPSQAEECALPCDRRSLALPDRPGSEGFIRTLGFSNEVCWGPREGAAIASPDRAVGVGLAKVLVGVLKCACGLRCGVSSALLVAAVSGDPSLSIHASPRISLAF